MKDNSANYKLLNRTFFFYEMRTRNRFILPGINYRKSSYDFEITIMVICAVISFVENVNSPILLTW